MNRSKHHFVILKKLLLCMIIFSNILTTENGWREIDGTITVYKRPPYKERDAALCSVVLSFIWCSLSYYGLKTKEEDWTWSDKMKAFILPLTISTYFTYRAYTKRNMTRECVITLTPKGFKTDKGDSSTWTQLHSVRLRHTTYGSDLTKRNRSITFVLLDNTEIKINTDNVAISDEELMNLIKQFIPVGKQSP